MKKLSTEWEAKLSKLLQMELLRYILTGGMTTAVNYVIYFGLTSVSVRYILANTLAWCGAVAFAFFMNRRVVFKSVGNPVGEFFRFAGLRFATLIAENMLLYLLISIMGADEIISKLVVSIVTVIANYTACKYGIFRKGGLRHEA
ncbi:MAG: GtrA family protein [Anaerovoracaceae bacterium]